MIPCLSPFCHRPARPGRVGRVGREAARRGTRGARRVAGPGSPGGVGEGSAGPDLGEEGGRVLAEVAALPPTAAARKRWGLGVVSHGFTWRRCVRPLRPLPNPFVTPPGSSHRARPGLPGFTRINRLARPWIRPSSSARLPRLREVAGGVRGRGQDWRDPWSAGHSPLKRCGIADAPDC